ncbi:MAG TPA: hypothetical protein DC038_04260 [Clostridiales bacterium]|nr:hypothetical protein [Clostridiales bacterium]
MNIKKTAACVCTAAIILSSVSPAYGEDLPSAPYKLPSETSDKKDETKDTSHMVLTADAAVKFGLEHNKSIELLDNKIRLALVASQNASKNSEDLKDAKKLLNDASNQLFDKGKQLSEGQEQVDNAKDLLSKGIAPMALTVPIPGIGEIPVQPGANILDTLIAAGVPSAMADSVASKVVEEAREQLGLKQDSIDEGRTAIYEAEKTLELKQEQFKEVMKDTSEKVGTKIDFNTVISLDANDAGKLMVTMAGVNLDVTRYAKEIYKNQIAMLIQKNYYDALYAEKIYFLKKTAMERGLKQYDMAKLSYENGMKAKDDMLLGKMYYDGTVIALNLAEANYKNALYELKKNMNLDMNTEITLTDSMQRDVTAESLEEGLKSGLTNRIEIQQILGQLTIYQLNEELLNSRAEYRNNSRALTEARLLKKGAEIELERTKTNLKSEISQSYETMVAAGKMLESSGELINNAEEVVRIARLKYEQGFGAENALLKQLNLQESSGTMAELIAAQEKLAEVEAQVAQIRYSYTMARIKYKNDSGILINK